MVRVQEGTMALSQEERCQELARLVGIPLMDAEVPEVAERFESQARAGRLGIGLRTGRRTL